MAEKILMKGNEAIGEAAIRAGCRHYYGYPITPQTELLEYMARNLPRRGGVFIQAESELAAINMVFGAAAAGARAMTSSSSPGISLKQEGISYLAGAELPAVIVNICRGGPGLGSIYSSQSDYWQATRGGGHGDYHLIVLAPASVQEMVDLTTQAFYLADKYTNPAMILGDGIIGQMMEKVEFKDEPLPELPPKDWAVSGALGRERRVVTSVHIITKELEEHNHHLQAKYMDLAHNHIMYEEYYADDAELLIVAFGTSARVAKKAIDLCRAEKYKVGLLRPITLFPFPSAAVARYAKRVKDYLVVEMNMGQMVDDVRLAVLGQAPVGFFGHTGGVIPTPQEVADFVKGRFKSYKKKK
jgi:2-oxoglutarate ferredoxin oxidoreductase subunit alpha